jgi:serpin B
MMSQSGPYLHLRGPGFEAAAVPYGSGRVSMYAFLPDPGISIDSLIASLRGQNWDYWRQEFTNQRGSITMPVFKFEYQVSLNNPLSALGMGIAFDPSRADFSRMCQTTQAPCISEVIHKTFVDVNEKGTEAAAATAVRVTATAVPPRHEFSLVLDRPFLVAIYDSDAQALLFLGAIRNPLSGD